ncbi:hypothetical protein ACKLNR_010860 [Fusarium oxysporum f. sp. zingiberi]
MSPLPLWPLSFHVGHHLIRTTILVYWFLTVATFRTRSMDPVSIAATAITMAGIVIQGLRQAKAVRDAPADVDRLVSAVSELQLVLLEMHKMLDERRLTEDAVLQSKETDENLADLLDRAAKNLERLQTIADNSIVQRAWVHDRTLSKVQPKNAALSSQILSLTDIEDMIETKQYSVFHKIVLGLSKLDLKAQLEHSTATIDQLDANGMSALWWASARGDTETVRLLLSYGASVTTSKKYMHGDPLHIAAKPEIIHLLLEHGADVEVRDDKGRSPLHVFLYKGPSRGGSTDLLKAILERSADPNSRTPAGHTALGYAAMYGLVDYIHLLLHWGASLDVRKYVDGYTPLLDAVRHCHADAVRALLENGADYNVKSSRDETILHICARNADCTTMDVLAEAGMSDLDLEARDGQGMAATDCFAARRGKTVGLKLAMDALYASIRKGNILDVAQIYEGYDDHSGDRQRAGSGAQY